MVKLRVTITGATLRGELDQVDARMQYLGGTCVGVTEIRIYGKVFRRIVHSQ